jgi:sulfur-oxidizing protein SoxX
MMKLKTIALVAAASAVAGAGFVTAGIAQQAKVDPAKVNKTVLDMFDQAPEAWRKKLSQDETQKVCSQYRNAPPPAEAAKILAREKANIVMPADGKVLGDWKSGERLAQNGYGGRHNDNPKRVSGGNCYACHQLTKAEVSYGTMGPTLLEYGKIRKYNAEDAKTAYAKIYNAQAFFPCSNMPRLGHNKHLTEQQIKDIVALLFDPQSPVNK